MLHRYMVLEPRLYRHYGCLVVVSNFVLLKDTLEWKPNVKPGQQTHKRLAHTASQVGSYIFVIGGHTGTEYVSEILLYDLGEIISTSL
jgi:hypothetical protein